MGTISMPTVYGCPDCEHLCVTVTQFRIHWGRVNKETDDDDYPAAEMVHIE